MKKILFAILALQCAVSLSAQRVWDFTVTPDEDVTALQAATSEWKYTEASDRYENLNAISGPITAGGQELTLAKGLTIGNAAAGKLKIDVNKRLEVNLTGASTCHYSSKNPSLEVVPSVSRASSFKKVN